MKESKELTSAPNVSIMDEEKESSLNCLNIYQAFRWNAVQWICFSTNETSRWDDRLRKFVPSGRFVGSIR